MKDDEPKTENEGHFIPRLATFPVGPNISNQKQIPVGYESEDDKKLR